MKNFNKALKEFKTKLVPIETDDISGSMESKVVYLPDFEQVYWGLEEVRKGLNDILRDNKIDPDIRSKIQNDKVLHHISSSINKLFNEYRTHLRGQYPYEYNEIRSRINENSTGGVGEQHFTPKAFKTKKNKK